MCKYCKNESDDIPCCEDCYLNRQSHMVFYMNIESAISYMKVALSFITIGEGKKCLVYKR